MIKELPYSLVEKYFNIYAGTPKKRNNNLNGGCWHCKEGASWGKKSRLWYISDKNIIHCHNCNTTWSPLRWIKEVSGLKYKDILSQANGYDHIYSDNIEEVKPQKNTQTLPLDSINLFDPIQVKYYEKNKVVQDAIKIIKERRLDTCKNSCNLYISLNDYVHKNRICIPFTDSDNKIRFYQSRAMYKQDMYSKYLSKSNSEKTIFGLNKIDTSYEYLFITEGPIDSMFIEKNGISMAGLQITAHQRLLLSKYITFKKIWILDNQLDNIDVYNKYKKLIDEGENVFIWPKTCKYKDINEICCAAKKNWISAESFIKHAYSGLEAQVLIQNKHTN